MGKSFRDSYYIREDKFDKARRKQGEKGKKGRRQARNFLRNININESFTSEE